MITFKKFLEAEVIPIVSTPQKVDAALLKFIRDNCADSLWMFENASPIWRGERHLASILGSDGVAVIDTTKSKRSSQNTGNWYTVILDNHPAYAEYPKRSQSLICTTRHSVAKTYGVSKVMAIIPFDTAKIGWVNARDIWDKSVNIDGSRESLLGMNDLFVALEDHGLDDDSWESFVKFSNYLKTDEALRAEVAKELPSIGVESKNIEAWLNDFAGKIREAYADMNLEKYTPKTIQSIKGVFGGVDDNNKAFELWVGGKVLCMSQDVFEELSEAGI